MILGPLCPLLILAFAHFYSFFWWQQWERIHNAFFLLMNVNLEEGTNCNFKFIAMKCKRLINFVPSMAFMPLIYNSMLVSMSNSIKCHISCVMSGDYKSNELWLKLSIISCSTILTEKYSHQTSIEWCVEKIINARALDAEIYTCQANMLLVRHNYYHYIYYFN